ncbi:MAG TPA: hypothetical protein VD866_06265 [Urbifossiella sp.]|nr:hypothetical protein [Urbifossiella sp.]
MAAPTPRFWDVKAILDWLTNHRTRQQLQSIHGSAFQWRTRQELLDAVVDLQDGGPTFCLIDPGLVGNGRGAETNLVKALRDSDGVAGKGQMPFGGNGDGQHATGLQIQTIIGWIDANCPP